MWINDSSINEACQPASDSTASHHATMWVIKTGPDEPIRTAVMVGFPVGVQTIQTPKQTWGGQQTRTDTLSQTLCQRTLKGKLRQVLQYTASFRCLPSTHAFQGCHFLSTPPLSRLVSHCYCVPAGKNFSWLTGLSTNRATPETVGEADRLLDEVLVKQHVLEAFCSFQATGGKMCCLSVQAPHSTW